MKFFKFLLIIMTCGGSAAWAQEGPLKLSLADAVARALEVDETYLSAKEDLTAAKASITEAKSALYPKVTFDASATRMIGLPTVIVKANSLGPGFPPEDVEFSAANEENLSVGLTAVQPLYQGGRAWTAYGAAKSYHSLANENLRKARDDIVYAAAGAYYDAVLADEAVGVANTGVAVASSHVQATEDRYDAGLVSEYDVLRAKVELVNLETARRQAEDGRAAALRYLLTLLNMPPDSEVALTDRLAYEPEVYDLDESLVAAEDKRPELAQLELARQLAEDNVKITRATDNPSLFFTASYSDYANKFSLDFADQWRQQGMLNLALTWPIFDGFATRSSVGKARAELYKTELGKARLAEGIDAEVRGAYDAVKTAEATVRSQRENVTFAERGYEIAKARYDAGLMSNLEVLDAQAALTQARLGYYRSLRGYALAKLNMRRARGELEELKF
ncbi:MAG: TolC family protein [candidate division Zixibacteria bacterium]|nr:TolC family protein [candidate division Zixibacteria bacterium]